MPPGPFKNLFGLLRPQGGQQQNTAVFDPSANALKTYGNAGTNLDVLRAMNFFGGQASATGFESLQDILNLRGATDPMLFNQSLADIALTGQRSQDAIQGQLAALNLGGSGIGQGLAAASAAATDRGRARAIAEENRAREERMREDLLLLRQLLFDPTIALRTGNPLQGVNQPSDLEKVLGIGTGIAGAIAEF